MWESFNCFVKKTSLGKQLCFLAEKNACFCAKKESQMNFSIKNASQHILPNRWERPIYVIESVVQSAF